MSSPARDASEIRRAAVLRAIAFLRALADTLAWRSIPPLRPGRRGCPRDLGKPAAAAAEQWTSLRSSHWRSLFCAFSISPLSPASMWLGALSIRACHCDPASSSIPRDCPWVEARNGFCTMASLLPGTLPAEFRPAELLLIHCLDVEQPVAAAAGYGRRSFQPSVRRGEAMNSFMIWVAAFVLAMVALGLIRILRGPAAADRVMAVQLSARVALRHCCCLRSLRRPRPCSTLP